MYMNIQHHNPNERIRCPYCGAKSDCRHVILAWSGCNCDWEGGLADATQLPVARLQQTIWTALVAKAAAFANHQWPYPLCELVEAVADFGWDEHGVYDWDHAIRQYVLSHCGNEPSCLQYKWEFDGGAPGTSDVFGIILSDKPDRSIKSIARQILHDIKTVQAWAGVDRPPR